MCVQLFKIYVKDIVFKTLSILSHRGGSRTAALSKMKLFMIIVNTAQKMKFAIKDFFSKCETLEQDV